MNVDLLTQIKKGYINQTTEAGTYIGTEREWYNKKDFGENYTKRNFMICFPDIILAPITCMQLRYYQFAESGEMSNTFMENVKETKNTRDVRVGKETVIIQVRNK